MNENQKLFQYENLLDEQITIIDVGVVKPRGQFTSAKFIENPNIKNLGAVQPAATEPAAAQVAQPAVSIGTPAAAPAAVNTQTQQGAN